jgi:hypothetical protein
MDPAMQFIAADRVHLVDIVNELQRRLDLRQIE